jgi:hypothetical protein
VKKKGVSLARSKKLRLSLLKDGQPCIFCGGKRLAQEIEHMPPKGMFENKHRPKGLEFPSCSECNRGSRKLDDVVAFLAAIEVTDQRSKKYARHFKKKVDALRNNQPLLFSELAPTRDQQALVNRFSKAVGSGLAALNTSGPMVSNSVLKFGAKCAMALHWKQTSAIVRPDTDIGVLWFTNANAIAGSVPQDLFELLPNRRFMRQGKFSSEEVFEYSSGHVEEENSSAHWAILGNCVCLMMFVGSDLHLQSQTKRTNVFKPGCLANNS